MKIKRIVFPADMLTETKARFPHIYDKLELYWGNPEFTGMADELIINYRDEKREGFPLVVMSEIMKVTVLSNEMFPPNNPNPYGLF